MENTFITAVLLALVASLANGEYFLGSSMLSRPLVTCTLTGLVMGDLTAGIIMGATLELAFVGSFSIGGAIPPEIISGSILGTAFSIGTGSDTGVALTLGIPIASLVLIVKNLGFIFILPFFVHKADRYAEEGNARGIELMNVLGGLFAVNIPIALVVGFSYALGSQYIQGVLDVIPEFIINGLGIATGLLPAYGFALLLKMMVNKHNVIFFVLGIALVGYLNVPMTGVAVFAAVLAFILTGYSAYNMKNNDATTTVVHETGGIDYEDEEF